MAEQTATEEVQETETSNPQSSEVKVSDVKEEASEDSSTEDTLLGKEEKEAEVKTEEANKEEGTEEKSEVPEKYEFNFPEGMEVDEALIGKAEPLFKEMGLTQEQAQKIVDLQIGQVQAQAESYQKTIDGWKEQSIKDLGSDYQAKLADVSKFIDKYGSPEVRQVLNDTGLGNHPEVVKLFMNAGKAFANDSLAEGSQKTNPNDPERVARKMFPNTKYE